jgi:hypothetical protein
MENQSKLKQIFAVICSGISLLSIFVFLYGIKNLYYNYVYVIYVGFAFSLMGLAFSLTTIKHRKEAFVLWLVGLIASILCFIVCGWMSLLLASVMMGGFAR